MGHWMKLPLKMSGLNCLVGVTLVIYFSLNLASCLPASSRSSSSFYIIGNSSIPCQELQILAPQLPRVVLSDEQKMNLFVSRGGVYNPTYMARSEEEAKRQFPSLLDIPKRFKDRVLLNKVLERVRGERLTKEDIINYMRTHWRPREPVEEPEQDESSTAELTTHPKLARRRHRREPELSGHIVDELSPADDPFPLVFPNDIGIPSSYVSADGSQTNVTICRQKGEDASPTTQILCTTCEATTHVGENKWPSEFNEALCDYSDMECLTAEGTAHGECRQVELQQHALCKREGLCSLALQDGQTVVVDEWDVCLQILRVGCECTLKKTSFFAQFL